MRYQNVQTAIGPVAVPVPNTIKDGNGFYVSYNDHDVSIYGSDTTALVVGQMEKFYILDGDHRDQYAALIGQGLDACVAYFRDNLAAVNKHSDKLPELAPREH